MCIDKEYTVENRTTIYDNSNFKTAVSNLKEVTENSLFKLKYVIPYITTKHSIKTTKILDGNKMDLQELPMRSTLQDRKSTRLNSSHSDRSRMPSSA